MLAATCSGRRCVTCRCWRATACASPASGGRRAPSNAYARRTSERGEPDKAFAGADLVVEHTYHTQRQHQGYLETQTCLVQIDADGRVQVWSGTKTPHAARNGLAAGLGDAPGQSLVNHAHN